ncbi:OmpA/MotB family protein [Desulfovibrio sp. TomC]|uniref:OmpA/MotB family protein n=1 Tax=Desulfovibrio sp. TomC TaxID=1562888 RepID=UPI000575191F|nr:flagellar motor protein MotB [Desulfovibrio sp. TomC]KHK02099.1 Flagellar motor rotation protein MotB [Desulfovibrio sp. TomC]
MRGRMLKVLMVILVLLPVGLTAYLANSLYHRKGVPEALENLTRQLFQSKVEERKAETRAKDLERKTEELQTAYDALVADLRGEVDSRDIRVRQFREKLEINFVDKILFASGSAEIMPKGRDILSRVGTVLAKVKGKSIYVVGHTDNMPIHSALYPSNWELSAARAASVIRHLSETSGLVPERFTAMGRAFYQPVASNATPEGRQENRRVDIIVADVPLLAGETGSQSLRGTVSGGGQQPGGAGEGGDSELLRETTPPAGPAPTAPQTLGTEPAGSAPAKTGTSDGGGKTGEPTPASPAGSEPAPSPAAAPAPPSTEVPAGLESQPADSGPNDAQPAPAGSERPAEGQSGQPALPPPLPDAPAGAGGTAAGS